MPADGGAMPSGAALCDVAGTAATAVGDSLREAFGQIRRTSTKANFHDLVTEVDVATETHLRASLLAATPGASIVGEEGGASGSGRLVWHVDPVDGTNNFAAGIPFFCVSIGAALDGALVAGVVYDPVRDELFAGHEDGSTCNGAPIRASGAAVDGDATLLTGFPRYDAWAHPPDGIGDFERFRTMLQRFRTVRRLGSAALALAYVAAGRADVAFGVAAHSWDVAAGAMLVVGAGGRYQPIPPRAEGDPEWASPAYVAHVGEFQLDGSCLGTMTGRRPGGS